MLSPGSGNTVIKSKLISRRMFLITAAKAIVMVGLVGRLISLQINQAIENANLCGYFLDSQNAMLSFDDGGIVYLKSKQELINEGQNWIDDCNHFTAVSGEQFFSITEDGVIVIRAISPSKKHKTIKN